LTSLALAGALLAWLGAAAITVSDGRRALALGLALVGGGLGLPAFQQAGPAAAAVLVAAAALSAGLRLRAGEPGWRVLQAGSTPRLILALLVLPLSAYVALYLISAEGGATRLAALTVAGLGAARMLSGGARSGALTGGAALALGLSLLSGQLGLVAGGLVSLVVSSLPVSDPEALA